MYFSFFKRPLKVCREYFCACMCVHPVYSLEARRSQRGPELGVMGGYELPCGCRGTVLGSSSRVQKMLLPTEAALHHHTCSVFKVLLWPPVSPDCVSQWNNPGAHFTVWGTLYYLRPLDLSTNINLETQLKMSSQPWAMTTKYILC